MTARPRSSTSPYMFTWPRPGIQIGNCMRKTPVETSTTSSDAGSCSDFGLRARGSVSVTSRGYRFLGIRHRGELGPRAVGLRERTAREHELLVVAAGDDLETDRETVGRAARGDAHRGHPRDVERCGERHRAHPADRLARDLERR